MKYFAFIVIASFVFMSVAKAEIIPVSNDRLLTEQDLIGFSKADLRIARNEIFARHGYAFNSKDLQQHFAQYSWYQPIGKNISLSRHEQKNTQFIKMYENDPSLFRRLKNNISNGSQGLSYVTSEVPVMIYREYDLDPCGAGRIIGLDPNGDGYLSVRNGPGQNYKEIDRLYNDDWVASCDKYGNDWGGIVYTPKGVQDCTWVDSNGKYPYKGTCSSGWIFNEFYEHVAG
ncbi:YARHG domain-containing protein [Tateyamaria sp.]|nr:YARHG domain-containing protein [Tateyamaria sp.]